MVFKLHRLKPSDLQSIVLTQRSFRPLAQPLIFRTVEVTTCNPDDSLYTLQNQQSQDYINRFHDRLAFITSDHIANAVRRIHIHCISRVDTDEMTDCSQIHTALFAALHRFNNLTTLEACSIQFTEEIIISIFSLPRLRTIRLQSCRTDPSIPALDVQPKSRVIELTYTEVESLGHTGNRQVGPTGDPWWLRLLSREKTEEIIITQGHNAVVLFQFLSEGPAMQELVTLEISSEASPSLFLDAMVQCPVIEGFTLKYPYWRGEELTQVTDGLRERNAFSELIDVKGPFEFVYPLLEDRSIEDISVTLMGEEESYRLVREIREQGLYLVYLKLDVSRVQMEFIEWVIAFSTLEWIEISTDTLVQPNIMGGNRSIQKVRFLWSTVADISQRFLQLRFASFFNRHHFQKT